MANTDHFANLQKLLGEAYLDAYDTATFVTEEPRSVSPEQVKTEPTDGGPKLNPRSCVTCRRRKVRCDKHEPCSNCTKANIDCVFPPPGRAPRKPRRPQDAELLKRLRRLESVVDSLGAQVDYDGSGGENDHSEHTKRTHSETADWSPTSGRKGSVEHGLGRLVIKEGRSRYVSNDFWATLGEEISEIRSALDEPSSDEEDEANMQNKPDLQNQYQSHQGFVFGYSSMMLDMSKLHPSPSQIFILWEIYKENVDLVLKILHGPTVKNVITKAAVSSASLSRTNEALFYAICFAAVVSMTDDQCQSLLDDRKGVLMQKYRFAVEQALSRAQFLNSSSILVLQAFVLYLMVVKYMDNSRAMWSLAGLAMQQAIVQGLHRDGSNFDIGPFDTEMRRRLWWHILLLDSRASEDHGADPSFNERFFDTRLPLNVNDEDIWPGMKETPAERPGASEMTFCLMRFALGDIQRKLRLPTSLSTGDDQIRALEEKEQLIDAAHHHMEETYFSHCDPSIPFCWVTATVGRLILAKMWLMVHHPRLNSENHNAEGDLKEKIFTTSVEVIEFGHLLSSNKNTSKWSWLFRTYMQWHAVAFVLSELCHRPPGPDTDRAWQAVDSVYDFKIYNHNKAQRGVLWKPIKQLHARARAHRDQINGQSPRSQVSAGSSNSQGPTGSNSNLTSPQERMLNESYISSFGATVPSWGSENVNRTFPELDSVTIDDMANGYAAMPQGQMPVFDANNMQWAGWTPEIGDFDIGLSMPPQNWTLPQQQEWY